MCANLNAHFTALVISGSIRVVPIYIVAVMYSAGLLSRRFLYGRCRYSLVIIYGLGLYKPINWHLAVDKDLQPLEAV